MSNIKLLGFEVGISRANTKDPENLPSVVPPGQDDGSIEIAQGGAYGTYVDLEGKAKSEGDLVTKYRNMSLVPETDAAIQDVVNESIVNDENSEGPVRIVLDGIKYPESIKKKIRDEYEVILKLLDFKNRGYDIFRRWYVDGRSYYQLVIDNDNPKEGIKDLRYIDPRKIRRIKQSIKTKDPQTGVILYKGANIYYLYNPGGLNASNANQGIKISKDSIVYTHSGLMDSRSSLVYSHLHKAIKPMNQLRMLEDATVIYRLARAPERRIFYIDVGNLPKAKAEQYLRDMMVKHKNKVTYDASTGEVKDDRKFMTMLEDFWLPRREGGKGTEITTLPGGQNLGEMDDVEYFKRKFYKSLNVPVSRLDSENQFNLGRGSEITRDEVKFSKFIKRLRTRFSMMFDDMLEIQLALKGVMNRAEWKVIKQDVQYDFIEDNHYEELKETEIFRERLQLLADADQYDGKYFSKAFINRKVLRLTEEEVEQMTKEIDEEEPEREEEEAEEMEKAQAGAGPQEPEPIQEPEPAAPVEPIQDPEPIEPDDKKPDAKKKKPKKAQEEFDFVSKEEQDLLNKMNTMMEEYGDLSDDG